MGGVGKIVLVVGIVAAVIAAILIASA